MKHRRSRRLTRYPSVFAWNCLLIGWVLTLITLGAVLGIWASRTKQWTVQEELPKEAEATNPVTSSPLFVSTIAFPSTETLRKSEPTILIYHTHTTEAYCPTEQNSYETSGDYRTKDQTKNVVAVGEALKQCLEEQYGFTVLHDTTDHEPPQLSTAYERSEQTMNTYREAYPSLVLFIDLHRDAYNVTDEPTTDFVSVYQEEAARLMFVVGKGEKYDEKPYFESNLVLATLITDHLNSIHEEWMRPIRIKSGRYNQHIAPHCLLVEVGHNANTLEQALAAVPYLAEGIAFAFSMQEASLLPLSIDAVE